MSKSKIFKGSSVAIVTPFRNGKLDEKKLADLDQLAFPEDLGEDETRDFTKWARSPIYFPKKLLSALINDEIEN